MVKGYHNRLIKDKKMLDSDGKNYNLFEAYESTSDVGYKNISNNSGIFDGTYRLEDDDAIF